MRRLTGVLLQWMCVQKQPLTKLYSLVSAPLLRRSFKPLRGPNSNAKSQLSGGTEKRLCVSNSYPKFTFQTIQRHDLNTLISQNQDLPFSERMAIAFRVDDQISRHLSNCKHAVHARCMRMIPASIELQVTNNRTL